MQKTGFSTLSSQISLAKLLKSMSFLLFLADPSARVLNNLKTRITLVFKLPTSQAGLQATNELLEETIHLVDSLAKHKFRPEVIILCRNLWLTIGH